ncbi:MAG TPA: hypothetical protein VMM93_11600 [Vicinamibacterales bacterium]|nr:hypothetical protein [Vicinamibacterales bacterium]
MLIFLWASVVNTQTALDEPRVYLEYAALTPSSRYRDFITGWFSQHITAMVVSIAAGQFAIAVLLALPRRWRLAGVIGAVTFLLAIAPLGVGSGFPFPLTFGAVIVVADRLLIRQAQARLADSPAARFFTRMDVYERHEVIVRAPAPLVFETAVLLDVMSLPVVRTIFGLRALVMRSSRPPASWPDGLLAETRALGWRQLDLKPDTLVVMGAVTQPWHGDVQFRGLSADEFTRFADPNQVRIAWTLEATPLGPARTRLRTDTIVAATDAAARRRFRRYWLGAGFGVIAIRLFLLPAIRRQAERRFRLRAEPVPAGPRAD